MDRPTIYRITLFDDRGRVAQTREMGCADDGEARERTAQIAHPFDVELWDRDRLVGRFPPAAQD